MSILRRILLCTFFFVLLAGSSGLAGPISPSDIQKLLPANVRIDSLMFRQDVGLYEVIAQGNIFYMTPDMKYMFVGNIVEVATRRNLTAEKVQAMRKLDFASLPLADSIRLSEGKRSLAVFSDPDCSFCRKLHPELKKLKDVSVYVFLITIGISGESKRKADQIWCSQDRAKALDGNFTGRPPSGGSQCETPTERNTAFAHEHFISSTPVIIFDDNEIINGYADVRKIEEVLSKKKGG